MSSVDELFIDIVRLTPVQQRKLFDMLKPVEAALADSSGSEPEEINEDILHKLYLDSRDKDGNFLTEMIEFEILFTHKESQRRYLVELLNRYGTKKRIKHCGL